MSKVKLKDIDIDKHTKEKLRHKLRRTETQKIKRRRIKHSNNKFFVKDYIPQYIKETRIEPEHIGYIPINQNGDVCKYGENIAGTKRVIIPERKRIKSLYIGDKEITPYIQERSRGSKKWLRKIAARKTRYNSRNITNDEDYGLSRKNNEYKKMYDLWWSIY